MLCLFFQDCGWQGSIVVIAETEEEARDLMSASRNYSNEDPVEKHEIVKGLIVTSWGDS